MLGSWLRNVWTRRRPNARSRIWSAIDRSIQERPVIEQLETRILPALTPITVVISELVTISNPDGFPDGSGDYFAVVHFNGRVFSTKDETVTGDVIFPEWTFTDFVDLPVHIKIQIFDEDGFLAGDDDIVDVHPASGLTSIDLTFRPDDYEFGGFTEISQGDNVEDTARITYRVAETPIKVQVDIPQLHEIWNPDGFNADHGDYYAMVKFGDQGWQSSQHVISTATHSADGHNGVGPGHFSFSLGTFVGYVEAPNVQAVSKRIVIQIAVFDFDDFNSDDMVDINPALDQFALSIVFPLPETAVPIVFEPMVLSGTAEQGAAEATIQISARHAPGPGHDTIAILVNDWGGVGLSPLDDGASMPEVEALLRQYPDVNLVISNWNDVYRRGFSKTTPLIPPDPVPLTDERLVIDILKLLTAYDDGDTIILIGHGLGAEALLEVASLTDQEIDLLAVLNGRDRQDRPSTRPVEENVKYFYNRYEVNSISSVNSNAIWNDFGIVDQQRAKFAHKGIPSDPDIQNELVQIVSSFPLVDPVTGILTLSGTAEDDEVTIRSRPDQYLEVIVNGVPALYHYGSLSSIQFTSGEGSDVITLEVTEGDLHLLDGLHLHAGSDPFDADKLILRGEGFDTVRYQSSGFDSGTISLDLFNITFSGIDEIVDLSTATERAYENHTDFDEYLEVTDDAFPNNGISALFITGSNELQSILFTNPSLYLTVQAGAGQDHLRIDRVDADFAASIWLYGGNGDDSFEITSLINPVEIDGGIGNDHVDFSSLTAGGTVIIDGVSSSFQTDFGMRGSYSYGAGGTLDNVEGLIGSAGDDTLHVDNSSHTWSIDGPYSGSVWAGWYGLEFSSFEHLVGGGQQNAVSFTGGRVDSLDLPDGTASINNTDVVNSSISHLTFAGSNLILNDSVAIDTMLLEQGTVSLTAHLDLQTLHFQSGKITGDGNLSVVDLEWMEGTMDGAGTTSVRGSLQIGTAGPWYQLHIIGRDFVNGGTATWSSTTGSVTQRFGTSFYNLESATLTIRNDLDWFADTTVSAFHNQGRLTKESGPGTTTFSANLVNQGNVQIHSGSLSLVGEIDSNGTFQINTGATLILDDERELPATFGSLSHVSGAGDVEIAPFREAAWLGSYDVSGLTKVLGTASFDRLPVTLGSLLVDNGTLTGQSHVTVTDQMIWTGGILSGSGETSINAGATLDILGEDVRSFEIRERTMNNSGTVNLSISTDAQLWFGDGMTFNNQVNAVFDLKSDSPRWMPFGAEPVFNNRGTFVKSAGANTTEVDITFNNSGTVSILQGGLNFVRSYHTEGDLVLTEDTVIATGSSLDIDNGTLSGSGIIQADVTNGATVSPGFSPGLVQIQGSYTQLITGEYVVELSGTNSGQHDQLIIEDGIALDGTLQVVLINGFVPAAGNTFKIIDNTSDDAIVGAFTDMAEGSLFIAQGQAYRISYRGGDGNDVVLTAANLPTNEFNPVLEDVDFTIARNATTGTVIGTLQAVDADEVYHLAYSIVQGNAARIWGINAASGQLQLMDASLLASASSPLVLTVQVTDGGPDTPRFDVALVTITISEVNSHSPVFTTSDAVTVSENSGSVVTVTASDADLPSQVITFSITGGVDASRFAITGGGVLTFQTAPDYESPTDANGDNVYLLQVTASDGQGGDTIQNLAVTVTAVNEHQPEITSSSEFTINEGVTTVATIVAVDDDLPAQALVYSITGGSDAARFSLTQAGVLTFAVAPDFGSPADADSNNVYQVQVSASDGHGLTTSQNISVTVANVVQPTVLHLNGQAVTWIKNQAPVALFPQLTVTGEAQLAGGTLTLSVNAIGTKKKLMDAFSTPAIGTIGSGQPVVSNGKLTLQVQLLPDVSITSIQSFLRGITFATKGKGLKSLTRTVSVTLDVSDSATTILQTVNVRKKATEEDPGPTDTVSFSELREVEGLEMPNEGYHALASAPDGTIARVLWQTATWNDDAPAAEAALYYGELQPDGSWIDESIPLDWGSLYLYGTEAQLFFDASNVPHVILDGGYGLAHLRRNSIDWELEFIEFELQGVTGLYSDDSFTAAMGPNGEIHVAFSANCVGSETTPIVYGTNSSGEWTFEVAFEAPALFSSGTAFHQTGTYARYFQLAVDSQNRGHVVYAPEFESTPVSGGTRRYSELAYATNRSGTWTTETIDRPLDGTGDAGLATSIAINPATDRPAIASFHVDRAGTGSPSAGKLLYHTQQADGSWSLQTVASSADRYVAGDGNQGTGFAPQLIFDSEDRANILFCDYASQHFSGSGADEFAGQLRHARLNGNVWRIETVLRQSDPIRNYLIHPAFVITGARVSYLAIWRRDVLGQHSVVVDHSTRLLELTLSTFS